MKKNVITEERIPEEFRTYLKRERKSQGYTTHELAEKAGISVSAINRLENNPNANPPKYDTIKKLAVALNIDPVELQKKLGFIEKPVNISDYIFYNPMATNKTPEEINEGLSETLKRFSSQFFTENNEYLKENWEMTIRKTLDIIGFIPENIEKIIDYIKIVQIAQNSEK